MNNFYMTNDWKDIPVQDWHKAYIELLKEKQRLDKALDEACEWVASCYHDYEDDRMYWQGYKWKEFLLDNV